MQIIHPDVHPFAAAMQKAGIAASVNATRSEAYAVHCHYIINPDGSIRWIWAAGSKWPDFLRFYHVKGRRAFLFSMIAHVLFPIGLGKAVSKGNFIFYTDKAGLHFLKETCQKRWAFFSGTIGPNRKGILWYRDCRKSKAFFLKIALTGQAEGNLLNEYTHLGNVRLLETRSAVSPEHEWIRHGVLKQSDIGDGTKRANRFEELPWEATQQWMQNGLKPAPFKSSQFRLELEEGIRSLNIMKDPRVEPFIMEKINLLYKSILDEETFTTGFSHGDFTPWNVMYKKERLHLVDWEMSRSGMPALYDLFHYIYQSNILIGNKGYTAIRNEINDLFGKKEWRSFLEKNEINIQLAEKLYLLYTTVYYLKLYRRQRQWHAQVNWLLNSWSEALSFQLYKAGGMPARKLLLSDLGVCLKNTNHAVLKWVYTSLDTLPETSDLDICIDRKDGEPFIGLLRCHPLIKTLKVRTRTFMKQLTCLLADGSYVHIDLIFQFKRKNLVFLDAKEVLNNASVNADGVRVPAIRHDFAYTWLFHCLNGAEMPERYQAYFTDVPDEIKTALTGYFARKYLPCLADHRMLFDGQDRIKKQLVHNLRKERSNRGWSGWKNKLCYLSDTLRSLFPGKGYTITFSGVDGAGKTTVIENVRFTLEKKLRKKVVVLRHRPSLLPILSVYRYGKQEAELKAASMLPRQGSNRNLLSSLLRFSYYYADYLLGQFYVQIRYTWRGYVVLYDRYYFDFITDGKRSNLSLPPVIIRWLYRFLLKPRFNFFLYADAKLILERKQELNGEVIKQLTYGYLRLFDRLNRRSSKAVYLPIENIVLRDTLSTIFQYIKNQAV